MQFSLATLGAILLACNIASASIATGNSIKQRSEGTLQQREASGFQRREAHEVMRRDEEDNEEDDEEDDEEDEEGAKWKRGVFARSCNPPCVPPFVCSRGKCITG